MKTKGNTKVPRMDECKDCVYLFKVDHKTQYGSVYCGASKGKDSLENLMFCLYFKPNAETQT